MLESFTKRENAEIYKEGSHSEYPVEPFTNYVVARIEQDIDKGNTVVGGIVTSTNREINSDNFITLPASAYTGGVNMTHYWKNKDYQVSFRGIFSSIYGSKESITELQTISTHNFQRPDATHLKVDSSLTSLSGHGGTLEFAKFGGGHLRMLSWITWSSPGLDFNDLGFMQEADNIQQVFWMGYNEWQPKYFYNRYQFGGNFYTVWNFAGQNVAKGYQMNGNLTFKNYYHVFTGFNLQGESLSSSDLRGGPMLKSPGTFNYRIGVSTDERKKMNMELFMMKRWSQYDNSTMSLVEISQINIYWLASKVSNSRFRHGLMLDYHLICRYNTMGSLSSFRVITLILRPLPTRLLQFIPTGFMNMHPTNCYTTANRMCLTLIRMVTEQILVSIIPISISFNTIRTWFSDGNINLVQHFSWFGRRGVPPMEQTGLLILAGIQRNCIRLIRKMIF